MVNMNFFSGYCREHLGCWKDKGSSRAISGGGASYDNNPVDNCHDRAAGNGYHFFAVQSEDECFTAADAGDTYQKYGSSSSCKNGVGHNWVQDVYKIVPCATGA